MSQFQAGPTVEAFVEVASHAGDLISSDLTGRSWFDPSVLDQMTVGDVAGHLFLVLRRVGKRAEVPPSTTAFSPLPGALRGWSWIRVDAHQDLDLSEHRRVREDAAHVANWGWDGVRDAYLARILKVSAILHRSLPPPVHISGRALPFDAYLATRIVELVVHADDLACSLGLVVPQPEAAMQICIQTLVDAARTAHGDMSLIRALSRRERAGNISVF